MGLFISRIYHIKRCESLGMNVYYANNDNIESLYSQHYSTHPSVHHTHRGDHDDLSYYRSQSSFIGSPHGTYNNTIYSNNIDIPLSGNNIQIPTHHTNITSTGTKSMPSSILRDPYHFANQYAKEQAQHNNSILNNNNNTNSNIYGQSPHTPTHTIGHGSSHYTPPSYNITNDNPNISNIALPNQITNHTRNNSVINIESINNDTYNTNVITKSSSKHRHNRQKSTTNLNTSMIRQNTVKNLNISDDKDSINKQHKRHQRSFTLNPSKDNVQNDHTYIYPPLTPPVNNQNQQSTNQAINKQYSHSHLLNVYSPQHTPPVINPNDSIYQHMTLSPTHQNNNINNTNSIHPSVLQSNRKLKRSGTVAILKKQRSQHQLQPYNYVNNNNNNSKEHGLQNYLSSPTATVQQQSNDYQQYILNNTHMNITPSSHNQSSYNQSMMLQHTPPVVITNDEMNIQYPLHHTISISPPNENDNNNMYNNQFTIQQYNPTSPTHKQHPHQRNPSISLYPPQMSINVIPHEYTHQHSHILTLQPSNSSASSLYDDSNTISPSNITTEEMHPQYDNRHNKSRRASESYELPTHTYNNNNHIENNQNGNNANHQHMSYNRTTDGRTSYTPSLRREAFGLPPMLNTSIIQQNEQSHIVSLHQHSATNSINNKHLVLNKHNNTHISINQKSYKPDNHQSIANDNSLTYFHDGISPLDTMNKEKSILPIYTGNNQNDIQALKDSLNNSKNNINDNNNNVIANSRAIRPDSRFHHRNNSLSDISKENVSNWRRGEMLGAGAYGRVYLGLHLITGQLMAVKQVTLMNINGHRGNSSSDKIHEIQDAAIESLQQEIAVMQTLSHDNIVNYLGTERTSHSLNIFLEYVPGGSISSLLRKFGKFNSGLVRIYSRQILSGLSYLHSNNICHRDIKGGNILLDNNGICKLADFGAAKQLDELAVDDVKSLHGTINWMAPEVIKQTGTGKPADIWSLGCTILEMLTGRAPWNEYTSNVAAMYHIANSTAMPQFPSKDILDDNGVHFLTMCFQRKPHERPTAPLLLKHPWLNININDIKNQPLMSPTAATSNNNSIDTINNNKTSPTSEDTNKAAMNQWIEEHTKQVNKRVATLNRRHTSTMNSTEGSNSSPSVSTTSVHNKLNPLNTPTIDENTTTINSPVSTISTYSTNTSTVNSPIVVISEEENNIEHNDKMISPAATTVDSTPLTVNTVGAQAISISNSPSRMTNPDVIVESPDNKNVDKNMKNGPADNKDDHELGTQSLVIPSKSLSSEVSNRRLTFQRYDSNGNPVINIGSELHRSSLNASRSRRKGSGNSNGAVPSAMLLRAVTMNQSRYSTSTRHSSTNSNPRSLKQADALFEALSEINKQQQQQNIENIESNTIDESNENISPSKNNDDNDTTHGADVHDVLDFINSKLRVVDDNVSRLLAHRPNRMTQSYLASRVHSRENSLEMLPSHINILQSRDSNASQPDYSNQEIDTNTNSKPNASQKHDDRGNTLNHSIDNTIAG